MPAVGEKIHAMSRRLGLLEATVTPEGLAVDRERLLVQKMIEIAKEIIKKDRAGVIAALRRKEKAAERAFRRKRGKNRVAATARRLLLRQLQRELTRIPVRWPIPR